MDANANMKIFCLFIRTFITVDLFSCNTAEAHEHYWIWWNHYPNKRFSSKLHGCLLPFSLSSKVLVPEGFILLILPSCLLVPKGFLFDHGPWQQNSWHFKNEPNSLWFLLAHTYQQYWTSYQQIFLYGRISWKCFHFSSSLVWLMCLHYSGVIMSQGWMKKSTIHIVF